VVLPSVTGEASPDYLVSGPHAVANTLRFLPRLKIIVSLREPTDRAISAYQNKLNDGTVHKILNPFMFGSARADQRLDGEIKGFKVPSFHELVRRANVSRSVCAQRLHFTMNDEPPSPNECLVSSSSGSLQFPKEVQKDAHLLKHFTKVQENQGERFCKSACFVSPFVHHGNYARYLAPWLHSLSAVLVLDYDRLNTSPGLVMTEVAAFLGVDASFEFATDEVMNTRKNRGVHAASSKAKVGGVITAIAKDKAGDFSWRTKLQPYAQEILNAYFVAPNKELQLLLRNYGHREMSWANPDTGLPSSDDGMDPVLLKARKADAAKANRNFRRGRGTPKDPF